MRRMRIYLAPCGMGLGHISRCKTIARTLAERGWSVIISTYSDGLEYARELGYPTVSTVSLALKTNSDGGIDFKLTAATSPGFFHGLWSILRQILAEMKNIRTLNPALVISDSRVSSLIAAKLLRVPSIALLNQFNVRIVRRPSKRHLGPLDRIFFFVANIIWFFVNPLIGWFWSFADKILIPDLPPPHTISFENLAIPKSSARKVEFIGPLLERISVNPSKLTARQRLGYDAKRPLILVPLSIPLNEGSGFVNRIENILEKLPNSYQIVMSRGKVSNSTQAQRRNNLTVYDWILNLDEHIEACDLVVSRAGHLTILSSLAYGKPLLIIPIPDHPEQLGNARRAFELGVAEILATDELSIPHLLPAIQNMLNSPKYARNAAEIGELSRRMGGTERVIAAVEQLSQGRERSC